MWVYKKDYSLIKINDILTKLENEKVRRINNPTPGKSLSQYYSMI
jgi:heterodisulfide reductase subunit A-like polyferredoxin